MDFVNPLQKSVEAWARVVDIAEKLAIDQVHQRRVAAVEPGNLEEEMPDAVARGGAHIRQQPFAQHRLEHARGGAFRHAEQPRHLGHGQFGPLRGEQAQDRNGVGESGHLGLELQKMEQVLTVMQLRDLFKPSACGSGTEGGRFAVRLWTGMREVRRTKFDGPGNSSVRSSARG